MTTVDVSNVPAGLFITGAIFILLIFSLLSFGILSMFQLKYRNGWFSFGGAAVAIVAFAVILQAYFV